MKNYLILLLISLITVKTNAQNNKSYPAGIEHVVIVGVDGMSPDGIRKAKSPVMHQMIAEGAVKWNVRTVLPSSSSPNWASMIMGAGTEAHGILDNDWEMDNFSLPPVVSGESGLFPTIFSVIRKAKPAAATAAVYQWEGFGRLIETKDVSFNQTFSTADATAAAFVKYLVKKQPVFAFLQLDDVDGAGHGDGHGTAAYYTAVAKADSLIGTVLQGIKKAGIASSTLLIIMSDHGGVGYGHGGATLAEAEVAMILYGKGVKKGYQIKQQVYTYDLAASIAFALKITPPYAWTGRAVKSAFSNFNEPENLWTGKEVIPSPTIYPDKYLYAQAGGLYIDKPAIVKMEAVRADDEIRYTIDGSQPDLRSALYRTPFSMDRTAVVKARAFDKNGNKSLTATAYFRIARTDAGNGLKTSFYTGNGWKHLPPFAELKPDTMWINHEFNLSTEQVKPLLKKDNSSFAVVMDGYIDIDAAGEYTFYTQSDDGSQLFVNNQKVVDNNDSHGVIERSGKIYLDKGKHPIQVTYFNEMGGFWLDAFYSGPHLVKQLIPANKLFLKQE